MKKLLFITLALFVQNVYAQDLCEDFSPEEGWGLPYGDRWGVNIPDSVQDKLVDLTNVSSTTIGFKKNGVTLPNLNFLISQWGQFGDRSVEVFRLRSNQAVGVRDFLDQTVWCIAPVDSGVVLVEAVAPDNQVRYYSDILMDENPEDITWTGDPHVGDPVSGGVIMANGWQVLYDSVVDKNYNRFAYTMYDITSMSYNTIFDSEASGLKPYMMDVLNLDAPWMSLYDPAFYHYDQQLTILDWAHSNSVDMFVDNGKQNVIVGLRHAGFVFERVDLQTLDTLERIRIFGTENQYSDVEWLVNDDRLSYIAEHNVRLLYVDQSNVVFSFLRNGFDETMPTEAMVAHLSLSDSTVSVLRRCTFDTWGTGLGSVHVVGWPENISEVTDISHVLARLDTSYIFVNCGTNESTWWGCYQNGNILPQYALIDSDEELVWAGFAPRVSYMAAVVSADRAPAPVDCHYQNGQLNIEFTVPDGTDQFFVNGEEVALSGGSFSFTGDMNTTYVGLAKPGNLLSEYLHVTLDNQEEVCPVLVGVVEYGSTVSLYPNPTTDLVRVTGIPSGTPYEVWSITGKQIAQETLHDQTIDFSILESGMYLIKIGETTHRVVKM
jgi:hypothetical protein